MMETIRSAANHIVVKIIFAIIILCFMFTGIGFLGFGGGHSARDEQQYIAKVDGEGLSREAFESQAREVTANAGTLGSDDSFVKQLRRDVLSYQIDNYLSYKFSQDLKANISDDQVKDALRKMPVFFENGKFSNKKYLELLSSHGYTPDLYAEILRTALQQQQVVSALANSDFVLPVDSELSLLQDQTRVVYATPIDPSVVNLSDVVVSTEDEQKYYDEHQKEFAKKERVKFKYLTNFKQDILPTVTVSNDEVQKEYDQNIKTYTFPGKNSYSIIYVTNKEEADDISKELSSGGDFYNVVNTVNQNSEISPYGKNGSLGWFADDSSLPVPFKAANLTKKGQISAPISVDGGYLIVRLDDIQKAKAMDFDYAKYMIRSALEQKKVDLIYNEREKKLQSALATSPTSLEDLAAKTGMKVVESDWTYFNDGGSIMRFPEVRDVIFNSDMLVDGKATGKISDMIPVGNDQNMGDVVLQVVDYKPEGIASFADVQSEINNKLSAQLAADRFKATVDGLLTELNEKGQSKSVPFSQRYSLTRNSQELDKKVVDMVFDLVPSATGKSVFGAAFINGKQAYITVLTQVVPPTEHKDISADLFPIVVNATQYYLASDMRSKAKIEIMPNSNL